MVSYNLSPPRRPDRGMIIREQMLSSRKFQEESKTIIREQRVSYQKVSEKSRDGYDGSEEINVLAVVKGAERYVFLYDDESKAETLKVLGRFASNPELSFTWYDAACLSEKLRRVSKRTDSEETGK